MKNILSTGFFVFSCAIFNTYAAAESASMEWRTYVETLLAISDRLEAGMTGTENEQLQQEMYRSTFSALAGGYLLMLHADKAHPDFVPMAPILKFFVPNPDDVYYMSSIDDQGIYRISGYRGTVQTLDLQLAGGGYLYNPWRRGETRHHFR
jgi:hypothetical protein